MDPDEIRSVLGGSASGLLIVSRKPTNEANDAQLFMDAYSMTAQGNFEGRNILNVTRDLDVPEAMHKTR